MIFLRSVFTAVAFTLILAAHAQSIDKSAIQYRLDNFIELTNQKKYNEAFDLMYPKLYAFVPKQDIVDMMQAMDRDGLSLRFSNLEIESYSDPVLENGETFVRIDYKADIMVDVLPGGIYDSPKASQAMLQQFQSIYGASNVKLSADYKNYTIMARKSMMAIRQNGGQWFLVEINTEQMPLMKALFSDSIIAALVSK